MESSSCFFPDKFGKTLRKIRFLELRLLLVLQSLNLCYISPHSMLPSLRNAYLHHLYLYDIAFCISFHSMLSNAQRASNLKCSSWMLKTGTGKHWKTFAPSVFVLYTMYLYLYLCTMYGKMVERL